MDSCDSGLGAGCDWGMLPNDFPLCPTVYWLFAAFVRQEVSPVSAVSILGSRTVGARAPGAQPSKLKDVSPHFRTDQAKSAVGRVGGNSKILFKHRL